MISNLKSRRYFFAFFRLEKASATRTWAGGCEAPDTRASVRTVAFAFLLREAGTWGLKKNSKMAAVKHQGGSTVFRVFPRFVAIVCLNFKARLSFFSMKHLFFWKLIYFFLGVSTLFMLLHILYFTRIRN